MKNRMQFEVNRFEFASESYILRYTKKTILSIFRFSNTIHLPFGYMLYVLFVSETAILHHINKSCAPSTISEYDIVECEWMQIDFIISKNPKKNNIKLLH